MTMTMYSIAKTQLNILLCESRKHADITLRQYLTELGHSVFFFSTYRDMIENLDTNRENTHMVILDLEVLDSIVLDSLYSLLSDNPSVRLILLMPENGIFSTEQKRNSLFQNLLNRTDGFIQNPIWPSKIAPLLKQLSAELSETEGEALQKTEQMLDKL
jgi:response regulator RpfG family c-di-GMP phosphodiesterase